MSVVVPTLNEERNLPYFFARLPRQQVAEVILVDGGSVDRTVAVARELYPELIVVHQTRTGKGNALACGFEVSTGDIIVMIDADGSTDPAEIPRFVSTLVDGTDYAKGSRFRPGGGSEDITRLRKLGNYGLNGFVNLLFGTRFTDLCYGYNAFWRRSLARLDLPAVDLPPPPEGGKLWGDGFEVETLINIRAAAHGLRIDEVASMESRRLHGVSNLNAFSDGMRVLRTILREYRRIRAEREAGVSLGGGVVDAGSAVDAAPVPPVPAPRPAGADPLRPVPVPRPAALVEEG
ncbi:glycosyltransferase family 2 protein [Micromonospora sp. NPDC049559]|uniref:glycosyltransferase family 2 protein n=1 Tax=Micromonospora sp. NPDC049559 TaxID=3155923 RepID=UPI00343C0210